jgi:NH3-dependent NAD+ synthetase
LKPDQKDPDSLPEYDILDRILRKYIEQQESVEQIAASGIDENVVQQIIRLVDYNEHKRFQAAPGLRVSIKAFGSGRRWPIVQGWTRQP